MKSKNQARIAIEDGSKDSLTFDFEKEEFVNITEKDLSNWKLMYPHIDVKIETMKVVEWIKSNPHRNNKENWRKYLTRWYERSNNAIENKRSYRSEFQGHE